MGSTLGIFVSMLCGMLCALFVVSNADFGTTPMISAVISGIVGAGVYFLLAAAFGLFRSR